MIKFENRSNGRYYYLKTEKDMLDEYVLVVVRGGYRHRVVRRVGFGSLDACQKEIERISRIRINRGYSLVEYNETSQRN